MNLAYFKIRRRRFRFSLGMLFLFITLLAGWLGYQSHWIRARQRLLAELPRESITWGDSTLLNGQRNAVPFPLWLFRERPVAEITFGMNADPLLIEKARRLFPEAGLRTFPFTLCIYWPVADLIVSDALHDQECPTYESSSQAQTLFVPAAP